MVLIIHLLSILNVLCILISIVCFASTCIHMVNKIQFHFIQDIVAAEFVDKREVGDKSGAMEPAALLNALNALKSNKIKVAELVTDAHPTISFILSKYIFLSFGIFGDHNKIK